MSGYNVCTKHGERGVMMEDDDEEENDDDNYRSMFPEYADTAMEDNEEEGQGNEKLSKSFTLSVSFDHSCAISVSFDDFLRYQVMKNLANHFPCRAGFGSGSSA
jgi:hypothetical protein